MSSWTSGWLGRRVDLQDAPAVASDRFNVVPLDTSEREWRQAQAREQEGELMSSSQESSASACLEPYAGESMPCIVCRADCRRPNWSCLSCCYVMRSCTEMSAAAEHVFRHVACLTTILFRLQGATGGRRSHPPQNITWCVVQVALLPLCLHGSAQFVFRACQLPWCQALRMLPSPTSVFPLAQGARPLQQQIDFQGLRPLQQQIGFQAHHLGFPGSKLASQGDSVSAKRRAERLAAAERRPICPPVVAPAGAGSGVLRQASLNLFFSSQPSQQPMAVGMDTS